MSDPYLVDLPAPSTKGTYVILFEPGVVRVGSSNCIRQKLAGIRGGTFRMVALLSWSDHPQNYLYSKFIEDRITLNRGFFRLSSNLISFINESRNSLGFPLIEEVNLWEYGGPLPFDESRDVDQRDLPQPNLQTMSDLGRYYTHLRWHANQPKASCYFCKVGDPRPV